MRGVGFRLGGFAGLAVYDWEKVRSQGFYRVYHKSKYEAKGLKIVALVNRMGLWDILYFSYFQGH